MRTAAAVLAAAALAAVPLSPSSESKQEGRRLPRGAAWRRGTYTASSAPTAVAEPIAASPGVRRDVERDGLETFV